MAGALDQVIDEQLDHATPQELAGAYRGLCAMLLYYSAVAVRRRSCNRNDDAYQKNTAKAWLAGEVGVISFPECCEALGICAGRAQRAMVAAPPATLPINKGNPGG